MRLSEEKVPSHYQERTILPRSDIVVDCRSPFQTCEEGRSETDNLLSQVSRSDTFRVKGPITTDVRKNWSSGYDPYMLSRTVSHLDFSTDRALYRRKSLII